jgi:hypothetical protein
MIVSKAIFGNVIYEVERYFWDNNEGYIKVVMEV